MDTWDLGWRTRGSDRGFFSLIESVGVQIVLEDMVKLGFDPIACNGGTEADGCIVLYYRDE